MRFFTDGPILPSELITARDEGRVVFFCGAGVSRARASLPDFSGLAERVIGRLRPLSDGPAQLLLNRLEAQEPIPGIGGLIATDRIFGLLEREFTVRDVREAVAQSLKPRRNVDLSCHRTLIDLARGPDRIVRLVTTNFDRLFQKADPTLRLYTPPNLPNPGRGRTFGGIVHLHGCVTKSYAGAQDDEFVLSSSDFGRAYLAEGWATSFIQSLVKEYQLVFVGYAADDPPMQYLLEALSRSSAIQPRLYAFQAGTPDQASALWAYKGVEPIAYDPADGHAALWRTLEAWSERARDVEGWTERLVSNAKAGPRAMDAVGRGQIAQLISTVGGANKFASAAPPGEWICVMDRFARYGQPTRPIEDRPSFDPFDVYHLDDDPRPPAGDLDRPYKPRGLPEGAWDAFSPTLSDREGVSDRHLAQFRGPSASAQPELLPRHTILGVWIARCFDQPIIAWWAAGVGGLHRGLQNVIRHELERTRQPSVSTADRAWRVILTAWADSALDPETSWFSVEEEIKKQGWSKDRVRRWSRLSRPRLKVSRPWFYPGPPDSSGAAELQNILHTEVEYPNTRQRPDISEELLPFFVSQQRQLLEMAIDLEFEISGYETIGLPPIERDGEVHDEDNFQRNYGLAGPVFDFVAMLGILVKQAPESCRQEIQSWASTGAVFSRLRIWAAGLPPLGGPEAARLILSVPRSEFWSGQHQRDLLLVLSKRWAQFPTRLRQQLERRLRQGPERWPRESHAAFRERRASEILNRLGWFKGEKLAFSFNVDNEIVLRRAEAPRWREEFSESAAASREGRSGWVGTNTDTKGLEAEPPATLLSKAAELSGRDHGAMVDVRPLDGLAEKRPVRYLKALVLAQSRGEFPRSAWETFLYSEFRKQDRLRLQVVIATRLSRLGFDQLAKLATPISHWMLQASDALQRDALPTFDLLWAKLLDALRQHPDAARSSILGSQVDWATHSLNSPTGRLAQALLQDPSKERSKRALSPVWLKKAEDLLALEGHAHRHALVIFTRQLPWLYHKARPWTETRLLSALNSQEEEDSRAFWVGFFWAARVPNLKLYARIKPYLLRLTEDLSERDRNLEQLSGILLAGWGTELKHGRCVSNDEMRDALFRGGESFRGRVLWQLARWNEEAPDRWPQRTITLLHEVWPRQSTVRTATMSEHLVDLVVQNETEFPQMVRVVLPLLTPIGQQSMAFFRLKRKSKTDAQALLELVFAALPQDASGWPYGADEVVEGLAQRPELSTDPCMVELRRRLAAR